MHFKRRDKLGTVSILKICRRRVPEEQLCRAVPSRTTLNKRRSSLNAIYDTLIKLLHKIKAGMIHQNINVDRNF